MTLGCSGGMSAHSPSSFFFGLSASGLVKVSSSRSRWIVCLSVCVPGQSRKNRSRGQASEGRERAAGCKRRAGGRNQDKGFCFVTQPDRHGIRGLRNSKAFVYGSCREVHAHLADDDAYQVGRRACQVCSRSNTALGPKVGIRSCFRQASGLSDPA